MNSEDKRLEVRLYDRKVGTLRGAPRNGLIFQYDREYIAAPGAVPLGTRSPLDERPWTPTLTRRWFDGLLPEGARRQHLAHVLHTVHLDTWSLLELAGSECAGAVQVVPPDHKDNPRLFELDQDTFEELLKPAAAPLADLHRNARLSLAGAQDKIVLFRQHHGAWALAVDGHASTHILKPPHPDFPELVHNEHWCMEVARRAGLDAALTTIERIGDKEILIIERYDRIRHADGTVERIHQEDLAQALGSQTKYQDEGFPSTYDLARVPGVTPEGLFDRLIVNWLVGNCDAHAKNYSILEPGTGRARLAPVYDVVSTQAYEGLTQVLGTSIGTARTMNEVTRNSIEAMGRKLGLEDEPTRRACTLAERVLGAIHGCKNEGIKSGPVPVDGVLERINKVVRWGDERTATVSTPATATDKSNEGDQDAFEMYAARRATSTRETGAERASRQIREQHEREQAPNKEVTAPPKKEDPSR